MKFIRALASTLIRRQLHAFERQYQYDMGYAQAILSSGLKEFSAFSGLFKLASHRQVVPFGPWFTAKWVATESEDCGSCLQLLVNMGREEGLPISTMKAISEGHVAALPADIALVYEWAKSTVHPDFDANSQALRERILEKWGPRGLVSLTLAMTGARSFPLIKRALGHQGSCQALDWDQS